MVVSNREFGFQQDTLITGFRLGAQNRALLATLTLGVDSMPVQYFDPDAARTVKLPLAAPNNRVWILVNLDAVFAITVTDDADAAIAGGTIAAGQTGWYQKVGAVFLKMGEMPIPA